MSKNDEKKTPFTSYDDDAHEQVTEIMSREQLPLKPAKPENEAPADEPKKS